VTVLGAGSLHRLDETRRQVQRRLAQREARLAEALRAEREARAQAQEADRRKDEFMAILGHELRNPLSPILTALRLLQLKGADREVEWEVIDRQARHLSRLVDDLLDVSRVASGRIALQRAPVELSRVVEHALEMTAPLIEERRHTLRVTVPESGLVIDADEGRMAQVVGNLLTNAAKYTDQGGMIRVHAEPRGDEVVLCVADDGQGIDPQVLPHLFDLFVQAPRSLDRSGGGLGIGLAIVRSLVELHGGTVSVHSDGPHTGSEITVRLPRHARSVVAQRAQSARARTPSGEAHRVLVVDDNRDAADILALALRVRGHTVEVAYDGPSALERLQRFEPEVALLDLGLPAMDGYALASHIHQHPNGRGAHLIAVTGYSRPSDRRRSLEAGFDLHLVKPIEPESLEDHIRAVVGNATAPREGAAAAATEFPGPFPVDGPGVPPGRGSPGDAR
jgi:CheY-like chemotaxis protein